MRHLNTLLAVAVLAPVCMCTTPGCVDPATSETEQGITLSSLRTRYSVTAPGSNSRVIAIVAPKGYTTLEADLGTFRTNAGFASACTVASGCLTPVNELGGAILPANDDTTALPQAGAVQMASGFCRDCKIVVVQLAGTSGTNLLNGLTTAAGLAPVVVVGHSISEGDAQVANIETLFGNNPNVRWFAASGDGTGSYPASSQRVLALAGTQDSAGVDIAWSSSRSMCSAVFSAPAWQSGTICASGKRPNVDFSALAKDVQVVFKNSTQNLSHKILPVGIMAGRVALESTLPTLAQIYAASSAFRVDVTSGTDATSHTAIGGYDLATGLGIPTGNETF